MPGSINHTIIALRTRYLAPAMRRLSVAWCWWTAQLSALLPENLREIFESGNQRLIVAANDGEFVVQQGSAGQLQEIGRILNAAAGVTVFPLPDNIQQTILLLPQGQVLACAMTLPLAAEENLREVLSFEIDRQTPFRAAEVYYDYAVTGRSAAGKTLELQLFVVPRQAVDASLEILAAAGIQPEVVAAHVLDNPDGHPVNLIPAGRRSKRSVILRRLNVSLATLALVLLVTAIALPLLQKNRMIDSLQAEVQEATVAAQAGNQLRREVEKLVDGSSYLIKKKQTALTIMQMLDEMTRVIPDDTWVNRIDMNNDEIQLQGQSGAAAGLIALIEASPMFHNTRFRSPVTQVARTEQERFHLSAEAVPGQNE
jgi:general secretion pathway protein L